MQLPVERAAIFLADRLSRSRAAASGLPCGRRCAIGFAELRAQLEFRINRRKSCISPSELY
jgi:hypothetical protein